MPRATSSLPLAEPLRPPPDPADVFRRFACHPHCLFLDSARHDATLGRYSFVAADPFEYLEVPAGGEDGLARLAGRLQDYAAGTLPGLPPFQGGAAGLLAYDLAGSLERVPRARWDEFQAPALAIGLYDAVVAFDHHDQAAWLVSQGYPERDPERRRRRAETRMGQLRGWLAGPAPAVRRPATWQLAACELAPQFPVGSRVPLTSNFSREGFLEAVARAVDYIHAGDVFQVNVSQRLLVPATEDAVPLYLRLRRANPAPFSGYFDLGACQIVSASPERFLKVRGGMVEARPIKGTRPRAAWPEADLLAAAELLESDKDRAENVMIVDLLRNDLSRVCRPESVRVTQLCGLEVFSYVQHLVSAVEGRLAPGRSPLDVVRAAFPGGSITGAPKVRAMEIIAELEQTARGPYCGCLGYLGFDGATDLSILIRTITAGRGWWQLPVGGGIVAQSDPADEYRETWHKADGMLRALT